jgi:rhodanese-related sulfurtransferase
MTMMKLILRTTLTLCLSALMYAPTTMADAPPMANAWPKVVADLVAKAKSQVATIDMETFRKVIENKTYDYIIDVREPNEFAAGHIPGAINIPRGVIEFRIWALTGYPDSPDTGIRLFTYCKTGSRCALAARSLNQLGFPNVAAVDMKLADWQAAGHPLTEPELDF